MNASAAPGGELSVFRWSPPVGSTLPAPSWSRYGFIVLELVPPTETMAPANLTAWGVYAFDVRNGEADMIGHTTETRATRTRYGPGATSEDLPPNLGARHYYLPTRTSWDRDVVHFVVAVDAPAREPFTIAFRILNTYPDPANPSAANVSGVPPMPAGGSQSILQPRIQSGSFQAAYYRQVFDTFEGMEWTTEPFEVIDRIPIDASPVIEARNVTLAARFPHTGGWGFGYGAYGGDLTAATFAIDVNLHGHAFRHRGPALDALTPGVFVPHPVSFPIYFVYGGGAEASWTLVHLTEVAVDSYFLLDFAQINLGAPLEALVGAPPVNFTKHYPRTLGPFPPTDPFARWESG